MYSWQKQHIKNNLPILIGDIVCNPELIAHLLQNDALSRADVDLLNARGRMEGQMSQTTLLLTMLESRTRGYEKLATALEKCCQSGAYHVLLVGLRDNASHIPLKFGGHHITLDQLLHPSRHPNAHQILRECTDISFYKNYLENLDLEITVNLIPRQIAYYITRSLSLANKLKMKFFHLKPDIFLIDGIELHKLTRLAETVIQQTFLESIRNSLIEFSALTDTSTNQKAKPKLKFVKLDAPEHFDEISRNTSHPVHWIRYQDDSYFYIKSNTRRDFDEIKNYLEDTQRHNTCWQTQGELLGNILHQSRSLPILIYDTPGMGKTKLLANMADNLKRCHPERNVIFADMKDFVAELAQYGHPVTYIKLYELLINKVTTTHFGKCIVREMFNNGDHQVELFLDGFDEVLSRHKQLAVDALKMIKQNCKNIRLFVTSRPHKGTELENILGVIGHCIRPFDESEQISLFENFWHSMYGVVPSKNVRELAQKCLSEFKSTITNTEDDVGGIPLQCQMLAELYRDEANRGEIEMSEPSETRITSTHKMYSDYVHKKLGIVSDSAYRDTLYDEHIKLALNSLFPEQFSFQVSPQHVEIMCKIGIVEIGSKHKLKYVHRTYADYVIIEFSLKILNGNVSVIMTRDEFVDFFFTKILKPCEDEVSIGYNESTSHKFLNRTFENVGMKYFLNSGLSEMTFLDPIFPSIQGDLQTSYFYTQQVFFSLIWCGMPGSLTLLCILISLLYSPNRDGLTNNVNANRALLSFRNNNLDNLQLDSSIVAATHTKFIFWEHLILAAAHFANAELFQYVAQLVRSATQASVSDFSFQNGASPLQVAVRRGNYRVVELLVNIYRDKLSTQKNLLQYCLFHSAKDKASVIRDKIQILQLMISKNVEIISRKKKGKEKAPILTQLVHFDLLEFLIENGAEIRPKKNCPNVAHIVAQHFSPTDYHKFVLLMIRKGVAETMFKCRDAQGNTPIHIALLNIELETETLKLLHSRCKVTFNKKNAEKDSEFICAIMGKRSLRVLTEIKNLSGDVKTCNRLGHGVICTSLQSNNLVALEYFLSLGISVNQRCFYKSKTLLFHALECRDNVRDKAIDILLSYKADVNASIFLGYRFQYMHSKSDWVAQFKTPLSFARSEHAGQEIMEKLRKAGGARYSCSTIFWNTFFFLTFLLPIVVNTLAFSPVIVPFHFILNLFCCFTVVRVRFLYIYLANWLFIQCTSIPFFIFPELSISEVALIIDAGLTLILTWISFVALVIRSLFYPNAGQDWCHTCKPRGVQMEQ